jgi:hypothetical protein
LGDQRRQRLEPIHWVATPPGVASQGCHRLTYATPRSFRRMAGEGFALKEDLRRR